MSRTDKMIQDKISDAATGMSYAASGSVAIAGGLSLSDWGIIAGIVFAGLTWATSALLNYLRFKRESRELMRQRILDIESRHEED